MFCRVEQSSSGVARRYPADANATRRWQAIPRTTTRHDDSVCCGLRLLRAVARAAGEGRRTQMPDDNLRQRLSDPPVRILNRLPVSGKLMIVAQNDGVTHERIGTIERRESQSGRVFCIGLARNCSIDPASVASVVIDRMARMKDGCFLRLNSRIAPRKRSLRWSASTTATSSMPGLLHSAAFQSPCRTSNYRRHRSIPTTTPPFNRCAPRLRPGSRSKFKCAGRHWTSAGAEKSRRSILRWASST